MAQRKGYLVYYRAMSEKVIMSTASLPLISVVIPVFNRADLIMKTLSSVLNQTYQNLEVIVVDDASVDETVTILRQVKDPRVQLIELEHNSGGTRPRNEGIARSQGEFIALLDSDDEWLPEKLEKQYQFIQRCQGDKRVCMTAKINRRPEGEHARHNKPLSQYASIMEYLLLGNDFQTSTLLLDAGIAKETLFDSQLRKHQDWDFALRLQENQAQFYYYDELLTIYDDSDNVARISSDGKREKSLLWLESIKGRVPPHIWSGFYAKIIADSYLLSSGGKLKGIAIYLKLLLTGKIKLKHFCTMMSERIRKLSAIMFRKLMPGS